MPMNLVELKDVNVIRGNNLALNNISLSLPLGQSHVILGSNGAGKSSLVKLISRELYPIDSDTSYVKILGKEHVNIWELRKEIGVISNDEQNNYLSLATGLEVVISAFFGSIGLHQHQIISNDMRTRAQAILKELTITELSDKRYINLSTGQQRRLLLARALVHKPKALLFDEPCSGLDIQARFWFLHKMRELCNQGTTVILVTHEPSEIIPEIRHVTMLKNGKIFNTGEKNVLLTADNLSSLYNIPLCVYENAGYYHVSPA